MSTDEDNEEQMPLIMDQAEPTPSETDDSDDEDEDQVRIIPNNEFIPAIFDGLLPAPKGDIARCIHDKTTKDIQRNQANEVFNFLIDPNADLRMLNNDDDVYTVLVAVPGTHKVKLLYGLGVGTARIGHTSPVANKLLTLYGEGGPLLGAPATLMFDTAIRTLAAVRNPTNAVIDLTLQTGQHDPNKHISCAKDVATEEQMMNLAPVPAYLMYDGFNKDLDAAMVYERLRNCQHPSPMLDHAIAFLRSCMIGKWREGDRKPFQRPTFFTDMPSQEARLWAQQRSKALFPTLHHPAPLPPPPPLLAPPQPRGAPPVMVQHGPGGAGAPVFNLDAAALREFFQFTTRQNREPEEKKEEVDAEFKVSELEKQNMRTMCGLPVDSEAFPAWFKAIHKKHLDDKDKLNIIAETLRTTNNYEDADVPLYPALLKTIKARDWTATDLGQIPAYVNAAKGLSPFAMIDLTLDDIAIMTNDDQDLSSASQISPADIRAARTKTRATVPTSGDDLMLMLKRYANLIFALFTSQSPLFKELHLVIKALKAFSYNARKNLPHHTRATILWILLIQSRQFAKGQMDPDDRDQRLGEFINMKHHLLAKSCAGLSHADLPDQLNTDPSRQKDTPGKRDFEKMLQGTADTYSSRASKATKQTKPDALPAYHTDFINDLREARKSALWPNINAMCKHCGVTRDALVPACDPKTTCYRHILYNACDGNTCPYKHHPMTKSQIDAVRANLHKFLKDPLELKSTGKQDYYRSNG